MLPSATTERGFTLTELAVVLTIVSLLLASLLYTLTAQTEQRTRDTTQKRLDDARELLLTYAIVNGRLPCPASATSNGDEAGTNGACTNYYAGYLPAKAIGFQPTDSSGYALDAWGNPLRYAVSQYISSGTTPHFTNANNLKNINGVTTLPNDLLICASASGITTTQPPNCGAASNSVTNSGVVAAVVWSQGKNYATSGGSFGTDETVNNKTTVSNNNAVIIWHEPRPSGATGGEYDDLVTWIPATMLYGRMVAAGVLP